MSTSNNKLAFNRKNGALEWNGQACPYVQIQSGQGKQIASLETARQELQLCLQILERMLTTAQSDTILQESLVTLFFQKYSPQMEKTVFNNQPLHNTLLSGQEKYEQRHLQIQALGVQLEKISQQSMSLRLALKPMQDAEALLSFYCVKKGKPVLSTRGIVRIRKLISILVHELTKRIDDKYQLISREYQAADLHGLYNLAYKNQSSKQK